MFLRINLSSFLTVRGTTCGYKNDSLKMLFFFLQSGKIGLEIAYLFEIRGVLRHRNIITRFRKMRFRI